MTRIEEDLEEQLMQLRSIVETTVRENKRLELDLSRARKQLAGIREAIGSGFSGDQPRKPCLLVDRVPDDVA